MKKAIVVLVMSLVGCATTPVPSNARIQPPIRILTPELFASSEGSGAISVSRDTGWIGSKCRMRLYLNAKAVADLQPGETALMHVAPGRHMLASGPSPDSNVLCRSGAESMRREVVVDVEAGKTARFRQALSANGEPALMPTAF